MVLRNLRVACQKRRRRMYLSGSCNTWPLMYVMCSIGDNWSFDDEVAAKYRCVVRAFDPRSVNAVLNYAVYMSY